MADIASAPFLATLVSYQHPDHDTEDWPPEESNMTATPSPAAASAARCGFASPALGRASICHCRMCQKAFGSFFGPLVTAKGLEWTRGGPTHFQSSNVVKRGFCAEMRHAAHL